jgi:hypothetical protein
MEKRIKELLREMSEKKMRVDRELIDDVINRLTNVNTGEEYERELRDLNSRFGAEHVRQLSRPSEFEPLPSHIRVKSSTYPNR